MKIEETQNLVSNILSSKSLDFQFENQESSTGDSLIWDESNADSLEMLLDFVADEAEDFKNEIQEEEKEQEEEEKKKEREENARHENTFSLEKDGIIDLGDSYILTVKGAYKGHRMVELIERQGHGYSNFRGTCGLCSTANSLRLIQQAQPTEKEIIDRALQLKCCVFKSAKKNSDQVNHNGGTTTEDRTKLAESYGAISKPQLYPDVNYFMEVLKEGASVVFTVHAEFLSSSIPDKLPVLPTSNHAITLLEIKIDKATNQPIGVFVMDTGGWVSPASGIGFIPIEKLDAMFNSTEYYSCNVNYRGGAKNEN